MKKLMIVARGRRAGAAERTRAAGQRHMKTVLKAAALIGVVTAAIAGSVYALGTVAHLDRLAALGFDGHQFPPLGAELHVSGTVYALFPALLIALVALAYAALFVLAKRLEAWWSHHPLALPAWLRIPIGVALVGVGAAMIFFKPEAPWIGAGIIVVTLVLAEGVLGKWVTPVAMSCFLGGMMLILAIGYVSAQAHKAGNDLATKAGKSNATTIVERIDGSKTTVHGLRIACSEHFCGFRDGETVTVISLEGVRSIQSPVPQEPPQPQEPEQPDAQRSLWDRLRGK